MSEEAAKPALFVGLLLDAQQRMIEDLRGNLHYYAHYIKTCAARAAPAVAAAPWQVGDVGRFIFDQHGAAYYVAAVAPERGAAISTINRDGGVFVFFSPGREIRYGEGEAEVLTFSYTPRVESAYQALEISRQPSPDIIRALAKAP